jgi:prophage regulatory protein
MSMHTHQTKSEDKPERLLRMPEVMQRIGLSRGPIYARIRRGDFPAQVKIGRASAWRESDIERFIAGL